MGVVSCSQWSGACLSMPPQRKKGTLIVDHNSIHYSLVERGQGSPLPESALFHAFFLIG